MAHRSDVPAGYTQERERGASIVALPSVLEEVRAHVRSAGSLYRAAAAAPGAEAFTGRAAAYRLRRSGGDWLVRHYHRGGAMARVLHDEYLRIGEPRPLAELRASARARARGVDTPEVTAYVLYPAGPFYRADIATRFIPDSRDLAELTLSGGADAALVIDAWRAAGALLRRAFDAGVVHADLNLRNLLVQRVESGIRVWLLDLDRTVVAEGPVGDVARRRMLVRLHRSRRKLELAYGAETPHKARRALRHGLRGMADG